MTALRGRSVEVAPVAEVVAALAADGLTRTAATATVYRLLLVAAVRSRGGALEVQEAVAGLPDLDPDRLEELAGRLVVAPDAGADRLVTDLGAVHERLLGPSRKQAGAWYTPWPLAERVVAAALGEDAPSWPAVCDPACGGGVFLVAAARRITDRLLAEGVEGADPASVRAAVLRRCVHGVDLDPAAVELARVCLWLDLWLCGPADRPVDLPEIGLRAGDALLGATQGSREQADAWAADLSGERGPFFHWHLEFPSIQDRAGFDVVLGNPPFLQQLATATARTRGVSRLVAATTQGSTRAYTDLSAVFLARAVDWVRDGGRIALVQPQSVLAARDAAGIRARLVATCALEWVWASDVPVFDAPVLTCALVLQRGGRQSVVRRRHGPDFAPVAPWDPVGRNGAAHNLAGEWSFLLAAGLGVPEVRLPTVPGVLGDLASCTADFRDQYYGLAPFVREAGELTDVADLAPLVTAGLIDPAVSRWGTAPTRYRKRIWRAPVVDLAALRAGDPGLARWAAQRLVPKVLVGTQGRVVEAVVDETGTWLPSVPTVTVVPARDRLWHVLAVLLAPPVTAHAATTYAGTALTLRAIKLSARQVALLPLPAHREPWDEAAAAVERAQRLPERRSAELLGAGRLMCAAYGVPVEPVLSWWSDRLPDRLPDR